MARWTCVALAVVVALTVAGTACAATPYEDYCASYANLGAQRLDKPTGLVADLDGTPSYAWTTPSWALACLTSGKHKAEAEKALAAIAAAVDHSKAATRGLLPWLQGGTPSQAATEVAASPLAACLILKGQTLSPKTQTALQGALKLVASALSRAKPESADVRRLYFAAACIAVGRACVEQGLVNRGLGEANAWLADVEKNGLADGHGPTTEAARLAALAWIKLLAPEPPTMWDTAWKLLWTDLMQRSRNGAGPLAGTQLYAAREDYLDGMGPLKWLIPLATGAKAPAADLAVGYTSMPFVHPLATEPTKALPDPASFTYTWSEKPLAEETIWSTPACSLATTTGPVKSDSIPVFITLPGRKSRPTAYAYTSAPAELFSYQRGDTALLNFEFDGVGWGNRTQVYTDFVLGPASEIKRVSLIGQPWDGRTVGVDELTPVCIETAGAYIGVVALWCGPGNASEVTERVMPAILQWMPDKKKGELVLRLYARQATYKLPKPENDYVVGAVVSAMPASSMSFADFVEAFRRVRYTNNLKARSWRVPGKDQPNLPTDKYRPKPKRAYYVAHATDYTLSCLLGVKKWTMVMDLTSEKMRSRSVTDRMPLVTATAGSTTKPQKPKPKAAPAPTPAPPALQFDTPLLKLAAGWRDLEPPAKAPAAH